MLQTLMQHTDACVEHTVAHVRDPAVTTRSICNLPYLCEIPATWKANPIGADPNVNKMASMGVFGGRKPDRITNK
jgi:hypothetical protein